MSIPGAASPLLLAKAGEAAPFSISRSLRFNSADSAYLNRTPSSAGNRKTWTWSAWVKRSGIGANDNLFKVAGSGNKDTQFTIMIHNGNYVSIDYGGAFYLRSTRLLRDPSAWQHWVVSVDTTNSTANNRIRLYINGVEETDFVTRNNPNQNEDLGINRTSEHTISSNDSSGLDGYLAEVNFIDGTALDPTSFGEFDTNGVWQAIDTAGLTFGTNGFRLKFADNSSDALLGTDSSGNSNTWTVNNLSVGSASNRTAQQNFDVVTYTGNGGTQSISSLAFQPDFVWIKNRDESINNALYDSVRGNTKVLFSNKTEAEATVGDFSSFNSDGFTVAYANRQETNKNNINYVAWCWNAGANSNKTYTVKVVSDSGNKYRFDNFGTSAVTLDLAEGSTYIFDQSDSSNAGHPIRFGTSSNGTDYTLGVTHTGTPGSAGAKTTLVLPPVTTWSDNIVAVASGFQSGYGADKMFDGNTSTYGQGNSGTNPSTLVFTPPSPIVFSDKVEIWHFTGDSTLSAGINGGSKSAITNGSWQTVASGGGTLTTLDISRSTSGGASLAGVRIDGVVLQDGVGTATLYYSCLNHSGMGGQINTNSTAGASNFDGSIQANVKANADFGFSVATYTGTGSAATVGHGLNAAPKWVIVKRRDNANVWVIAHTGIGTNNLQFDTSAAYSPSSASGGGGISLGNSTTISPVQGTSSFVNSNASGGTYVAYVWSEVAGFSKFSSYTGNGSGTGPVITGLGFKPKFVIIKESSSSGQSWQIHDAVRGGNKNLQANASAADFTFTSVEFNDDGFSIKTSDNGWNRNGGTYIYMAFAATILNQPGIDSLVDTPTNAAEPSDTGVGNEVTGNYATLNPLKKANITTSNGNLDFTHSGSTGFWQVVFSTIGMSSGKYYCEFICKDSDSIVGIAKDSHTIANDKYLGNDPNGWGYNGQNGQKLNNSSGSNYGSSYTSGDVIGIAFDADGGNLYFYKNGAVQNSGTAAYTGLTDGPYFFAFSLRDTGNTPSVNFGQRAFAYTAPSGYKSLNTANLPTPTIADGSQYFDTKLYTGNGGTNAQTGLGFSPDFLWLKRRNGANAHALFDQIRGVTKALESSNTGAEKTNDPAIGSFDSNGFTLTGSANQTNASGQSYVGWTWDAGTSTVTNNDGSIASQVRAQPSAGFSVVTWTGQSSGAATVGTGLNAAPEMIIVKALTGSVGWTVGHQSLGWTKRLKLNGTDAESASANYWNNTAPTSSVFTSGANNVNNTFVAYCFAPVAGYSAMGSYQGNGSSDGVFVHTGFRPAFILLKASSISGEDWVILDTSRASSNVSNLLIKPNTSQQEFTNSAYNTDILSNGFKIRNNNPRWNQSGATYIYYAVSENPFQANGGLAR